MNAQIKKFDGANKNIVNAVDLLMAGAHAAPVAGARGLDSVPSRHRLYNAAGGIGLWLVGRKVMNILVGESPDGKKIDKQDVPEIIRPLHGILAYNRYADDPHNQWMRVIDDLTPAIIGSVGAILGSQYFFAEKEKAICEAVKWGTKHTNMKSLMADKTIPILAKDTFVGLQQGKTWRILSGVAGVFSASSGMALLAVPFNILNYGVSLNNSFALANSAVPGAMFLKNKGLSWIYNTQTTTSRMPQLAVSGLAANVSNCISEMVALEKVVTAEGVTAQNAGRVNALSDAVIHRLFPKVTEKGAARFKKEVVGAIEKAVKEKANTPAEVSKHVKETLENLLVKGQALDKTVARLSKEVGQKEFGELATGNNGFAGWLGDHPAPAFAASAAGLLSVDAIGEANKKQEQEEAVYEVRGKTREDIGEPNQRVGPGRAVVGNSKDTQEKDPGFVNGPLLNAGRWLSDSVINVPPQNRLFSAVGLSAGLWAGYRGMRALAGKEYNGAPLAKDAKIDPILKWCTDKLRKNGLALDFKYFINTPSNRTKRAIFWMVPTATAMVGTYLGSRFAFRDYYKRLEHPEYLEDYTAKIAMTQGDKWGWLLSSAAVMASSSGLSNLPIPGLNYGIGLSTRSTLSYDKKTTMPGFGFWSGNKSDYYFGTKGALNYTIEYAVRNPSEYPKELPALAKATLEPIFPDVTADQVAQYVNKIQEVRNQHWVEGQGIPKEQQDTARKELKAMLRGAGFEWTLREIGLDPAKAVFQNGMSGKIANKLGAEKEVEKLAAEYREKCTRRMVTGEVSKAAEENIRPTHSYFSAISSPVDRIDARELQKAVVQKHAQAFSGGAKVDMGAAAKADKPRVEEPTAADWREAALRQQAEKQQQTSAVGAAG